jgi:hypothetical protein
MRLWRRVRTSPALERAIEELRQEWGLPKAWDLDAFVDRWRDFVQEVERGFDGSLDDYLQNLELRDSLSKALKKISVEEADEIGQRLLHPYDERLRFATRPTEQPLAPEVDGPDSYWWRRIPIVLHTRLFEDLKRDQIL